MDNRGGFAEKWTQNIYGKKHSFRNPLKQNYAHVKALETILELPLDKFIPIVAFLGNTDIEVQISKPVVYIGQLKKVIQSYQEIKFSEAELERLVNQIKSSDITTKESKKEHVKQIRTQVKESNRKVEQRICPKCNGNLVKRSGKYGDFTGCSNYPKCRYIVKQ